MKKLIIFLAITTCFTMQGFSQATFWYETTFESSFNGGDYQFSSFPWVIDTTQTNNIWQIGRPQKTIIDSAYSAPLAIITDTVNPYPANNISSFGIKLPRQYSWDGTFDMSFQYMLVADSLDGGTIEISYDNGNNWNTLQQDSIVVIIDYGIPYNWLFNGKIGIAGYPPQGLQWGIVKFSFNSNMINLINPDTIGIRFTFYSDSLGAGNDGWMIDDLVLGGLYYSITTPFSSSFHSTIFPNPASVNTELKLTGINASIKSDLSIFDVFGKKVWCNNITGTTYLLPVNKFTQGVYYLNITNSKFHEVLPFVVK